MGITITTSQYYDNFTDFLYHDWSSGAKYTLHKVLDAGKGDELIDLLISVYEDGTADDTDIDDFLRFEDDFIYEQLGIKTEGSEEE